MCLHFFKGKVSGDNGDEKFGGWGVWWDQLPDETDFPLHTGPSKKTGTCVSTYLQRHMSCLLYTKNTCDTLCIRRLVKVVTLN